MVTKTKFQYDNSEKTEQKSSGDTGKHNCEVFGCPRLATIKTSHWNCRYHNLRAGNKLDGITMILKNHEREIDWYEKVLNMPFHEYDLFKDNAPIKLIPNKDEDLIKYRVRVSQYISNLLEKPEISSTRKYTYADHIGEKNGQ